MIKRNLKDSRSIVVENMFARNSANFNEYVLSMAARVTSKTAGEVLLRARAGGTWRTASSWKSAIGRAVRSNRLDNDRESRSRALSLGRAERGTGSEARGEMRC